MKIAFGILAVCGLAANALAFPITIGASSVSFVDISVSGTAVPGALGDDNEHTITGALLVSAGWTGAVTNPLLAGGVSIRVGNNGAVIWGNSATDTFTNADNVGYYNPGPLNTGLPANQFSIASMAPNNATTAISNGNGLRQLIAPLWDDYNSPVSGTSIKYQVLSGDLYIQWTNEDLFAATGAGTCTFQMVVRGNPVAGGNLVDFVYQDTLFQANQFQNDGGSASIGYKNWGLNAFGNDVEFGIGGGGASATSDPAFNAPGMQPKVSGWVAGADNNLPHSVSIVPAPGALALLGLGGLVATRRRR